MGIDECGNRRSERGRECRVSDDAIRIQRSAVERNRDRCGGDHSRRHDCQRVCEREPRPRRASGRIDHGSRFLDQLATADDPVERVLQHAGHAVRVFRARDEERVARLEPRSESGHRRRRVQIRIERRYLRQFAIERHADTRRRQPSGSSDKCCVRAAAPKTSRDRQHAERALLIHVSSS